MKVCKLLIRKENWGRIQELMTVCAAEVDALEDSELSFAETQLSERIYKFAVPPESPKSAVFKFSTGFRRPWKFSATAFLAAAAAVLSIQVNKTPVERSLLQTKGLDTGAGIGCDISLVQLDQEDQDLTSHGFDIILGKPSYLKLRCEPGSYAHMAITQPNGLEFLLKNQALPSKGDFLREAEGIIDLNPLAHKYGRILVIVSKQAIRTEDLQWQQDLLSWKVGPRPLWSELINLQLR